MSSPAGVTPAQDRLHTLHKPQVLASGSQPSSGHAANTAQAVISGISKAQPSVLAARRDTSVPV